MITRENINEITEIRDAIIGINPKKVKNVHSNVDDTVVSFIIMENPSIISLGYRKQGQRYVAQWYLRESQDYIKIGQGYPFKTDLGMYNAKRDNYLKNELIRFLNGDFKGTLSQFKESIQLEVLSLKNSNKENNEFSQNTLRSLKSKLNDCEINDEYIAEFIAEVNNLLANGVFDFHYQRRNYELAGETKKDSQLRKIAEEVEKNYYVIIEQGKKDLYIYNEYKGVYEYYNITSFNGLLQKDYNYKFFEQDIKKIISTFTNQKKENTNYVSFKNCILNLKTFETEEHTPEVFCKFQVPFDYNKDAKSSFFEERLKEIFGDEQKLKLFKQILGYCFVPDNRHHKFFLLLGSGSNGKTTLTDLIRKIFGDTITSVALQDFNKNFGLQPLLNSRVNILYDLPQKHLGDTGILKAITGEDSITINIKHKDPVTTKIGAKIIGSGNKLPPNDDNTQAFYRRLVILELTKTFKPDNLLKDQLLNDELGMEWLIYSSIQEYSKVPNDGWAIEPPIDELKELYLKYSINISWIVDKLFEKTDDENDRLSRDIVYNYMEDFLVQKSSSELTRRKLCYTALRDAGFPEYESYHGRGFKCIKFK
ncbi:DNA primase family protein [Methanobacterium sp.]|uniref:DNA primase family protein n=1 Tax=Methanobacterium sp. TaxID=2164 RepID=UPI003C739654